MDTIITVSKLLMAVQGLLRVRARADEKWMKCGAVLIRPDAAHEIDARDRTVLIAFVDAESDLGAALSGRIKGDITRVNACELARWRAAIASSGTITNASVEQWVRSELLHGRRPPDIHPQVKQVLGYVREAVGTSDDLSLTKLAAIAGLSRSRFMHVFTNSVGVPLRPYILWVRLQRACGELMSGASITDAAHQAGFSDAAHLTRTFRRMLGTKPSTNGRPPGSAGEAVEV